MTKHYNITVSGKVQGVFYRASTKEKAEQLGIKGFVRNQSDGTVYIEAEGEVSQLDAFIDWCKIGSKFSKVENVHFSPSDIVSFSNFDIQH